MPVRSSGIGPLVPAARAHVRGDDCVFVAISAGDRAQGGEYPDIDLCFTADGYERKDGTPYGAGRLR